MANIDLQNTDVAFKNLSTAKLRKAWCLFKAMSYPKLVLVGGVLLEKSLEWGLPVSWILKRSLFQQFCGGEDLSECLKAVNDLGRRGVASALHYAVEASGSDPEFENNTLKTIAIIESRHLMPGGVPHPFCVIKLTGIVATSLLENVQSPKPLELHEEQDYLRFKRRLRRICESARDFDCSVLIDAEESWIQDEIEKVSIDMMRQFNKQRAVVYTTIQMYRKRRLAFLENCLELAKAQNFYLGVKLVRGAYLEKERERAQQLKMESPICSSKEETDQQFNTGMQRCLQEVDSCALFLGSHNENSVQRFCQLKKKYYTNRNKEGQAVVAQLLGMSDHITFNLAFEGHEVCKYVPFAPVPKLVPFLIRRARENTAVVGESSRELRLIEQELQKRKTNNQLAGSYSRA